MGLKGIGDEGRGARGVDGFRIEIIRFLGMDMNQKCEKL